MKEFITAVEEVEAEDEREAKIAALMESGKTREEAEAEVEPYTAFKIDGRELRAYAPHEGQLTFMLAALGRGQTQDQRFAAIVNIMLETLRDEDRDYLENRLLTKDRKKRIPLKTVEAIFEHLVEEWFGGKVTPPSSDSATTPPSDGTN